MGSLMASGTIPVRKIDKYILHKQLGCGAMGAVWLSHHMGLDIPVAIKVLKKSLAMEEPEYLKRFIQEGKLAGSINHPNIIRIYDAGHVGETYYLVMEYVEGCDALNLLAERGRFSIDEVVSMGIILAEALHEAHMHNIIHRDIKPDNIMVSHDGTLKLSDLGLAKHINDDFSSTINGAAIGSPNYISPEQVRNAKMADARSDIYSLGATLYHAITGQVPFKGSTAMDVMLKHCNDKLVPPKSINPKIPSQLSKIICKMMKKLPENRFQSCEELSDALCKFKYFKPQKKHLSKRYVNLEGTKIERLISKKPSKRKSRQKQLLLPVICSLSVILLIIIFILLK